MAFELLVDLKILPSKFKEYLTVHEAVRGEPNTFLITITNKGSSIFPGGPYEYVKLEYGGLSGFFTTTQAWTPNPCPSLQPNAQTNLVLNSTPETDGLGWLHIKIRPPEGEKISYYVAGAMGHSLLDEFHIPFYIVNKEQIRTISLLESLIEKLDKLSKQIKKI